eukprot:scaffold1182_cov396-Prasinococcus_capsulatus_cf.AAC.9
MPRSPQRRTRQLALCVAVATLLGGFGLNMWLTCGQGRPCVVRAPVKHHNSGLPSHAGVTHLVETSARPAAGQSRADAVVHSAVLTPLAEDVPDEGEVEDEPHSDVERAAQRDEEDELEEEAEEEEEERPDGATGSDALASATPRIGASLPPFECVDPGAPLSLRGLPEALLGLDGPGRGRLEDFLRLEHPEVQRTLYDVARCAVVGNGGVLLDTAYGAGIDAHTLVIRQNQAPLARYKKYTGTKATMRILNKKWLKSYAYNLYSWLPKERNLTLVASRGDRNLMTKLYRRYAPPSEGSAQAQRIFVAELASRVGGRMRNLMAQYKDRLACADKGTSFKGGTTPSSGLMSVGFALAVCKEVRVYGFGASSKGKYHYYQFHDTERRGGDQVHSFSAEFSLIKQLGKDGYLTLCTASTTGDALCRKGRAP